MKSALIALLFTSLSTFALDAPTCQEKLFDMMKCSSPKFGTVWASFGHVMSSDNPDPKFFATEIVYFGPDASVRTVYGIDYKKAMAEAPTRVDPGSGSIVFNVPVGASVRTMTLTWIQADRRDRNSFLGNFKVVEPGQEEGNDLLACTLN